jgi:hypothetical protein
MKPDQRYRHIAQSTADRYSDQKGDNHAVKSALIQCRQSFDVTLFNPGQQFRVEHRLVTRQEKRSSQNADRKHQRAQSQQPSGMAAGY